MWKITRRCSSANNIPTILNFKIIYKIIDIFEEKKINRNEIKPCRRVGVKKSE